MPILWLIGVVHSYFVYRLSMQGHDFLEDLRNQEVWDKIKNQAFKSGANLTWTFITAATEHIMQRLASIKS